jgi:hypothetical protein
MKQRLGVRRRISLVAALFVLLFFCLSTAGRCGLERMVNFGITLPLGEFAEKDKGLALTSGCLGAGLLYDLGAGVTLCGNFNYRHFGADLLPDSLEGSWQVLDLTGGLCPTRGKVGPHIPYLELGGGTFWPDLKVSTPMVDSILSYERSFGLYGGLGLKSGSRGGVAYELAVRFYRFTIDEGDLGPQYEFFVAPPSEMSGNFYYLTI